MRDPCGVSEYALCRATACDQVVCDGIRRRRLSTLTALVPEPVATLQPVTGAPPAQTGHRSPLVPTRRRFGFPLDYLAFALLAFVPMLWPRSPEW